MNGWLLDTNVLSELARAQGDARVAAWALAQPEERLFISVLNLAEYDQGLANLPEEAPARARISAAVAALEARFAGRVLALSDPIVRRWGRLSGSIRRANGQPPAVIDTMLAASAIEHDLCFVTRNLKDVRDTGVQALDPWQEA